MTDYEALMVCLAGTGLATLVTLMLIAGACVYHLRRINTEATITKTAAWMTMCILCKVHGIAVPSEPKEQP